MTLVSIHVEKSPPSVITSYSIHYTKLYDFFKGGPPSPAQQDDKEAPEISRFIAVNPPYGERLNKNDDMLLFYLKMGEVFKKKYSGWKIALLTGHRELSEAVGLRAEKINTVYNGGIRCILAQFRIFENRPEDSRPGAAEVIPDAKESDRSYPSFGELSPGAQMMYNRLKKNAKQLKKWINSVITSYSIHYTKLYDMESSLHGRLSIHSGFIRWKVHTDFCPGFSTCSCFLSS